MDLIREISELKETIGNEIAEANQQIKKSGGDLNSADIEMIDKLAHSMKSLVSTCIMLEDEENGYSEGYSQYNRGGYAARRGYSREGRENRENRENRGGSYNRYSRENRGGYSRAEEWNDHLRMMMDEAPDEQTRMDIKRMMDRANR